MSAVEQFIVTASKPENFRPKNKQTDKTQIY